MDSSSGQHLDKAISHLQQITVLKAPYVGLHKMDGKNDRGYIGSNKEGLISLATQLLQIAAESDEKKIDEHHAIAGRLGWINHYSEIQLDHIVVKEPTSKEIIIVGGSLKDRIGNVGIVAGLLVVISILLFGLYLIGYLVWGFFTGGGF